MYPNLKLQLWKAGIRQNRLANMLGMDESMVSKIMNGFREPSPELRARIAVLLKMDEQWLFERSEAPLARPRNPDSEGMTLDEQPGPSRTPLQR